MNDLARMFGGCCVLSLLMGLALADRPEVPEKTAPPKEAPPEDWSGWYWVKCSGGEHPYAGVAEVRQLRNSCYLVVTSSGPTQSIGVGMPKGKLLCIGWRVVGKDGVGVSVLERTKGGFSGSWAGPGGPIHTETWTVLEEPE